MKVWLPVFVHCHCRCCHVLHLYFLHCLRCVVVVVEMHVVVQAHPFVDFKLHIVGLTPLILLLQLVRCRFGFVVCFGYVFCRHIYFCIFFVHSSSRLVPLCAVGSLCVFEALHGSAFLCAVCTVQPILPLKSVVKPWSFGLLFGCYLHRKGIVMGHILCRK